MNHYRCESEWDDQGRKRIVCECGAASPFDANEWNAAAWIQKHRISAKAATALGGTR